MFQQYGTLKDFVPAIEILTRLPGRLLGRSLAVISGLVAVFGWIIVRGGASFMSWFPFAIGIIGLLVALFFMWRRYRLENAVTAWAAAQRSTVAGEGTSTTTSYEPMFDGPPSTSQAVEVIDEDGTPLNSSRATAAEDSQAQRNYDAMREQTQLRDTWMPRVEAAQRAAVAAAGGTVNAPYLKDDLRVTLAAAIAAGICFPIEMLIGFFAFFAAL